MRGACPLHNLMEVGRQGKVRHGDHVLTSPMSGQPRPRQGNHASQCDRHFCECDVTRQNIDLSLFLSYILLVLRNCRVWGIAPPGADGSLTSTGTSLLCQERGVPVARPQGGLEARRKMRKKEENHTYECDIKCDCAHATDTLPTALSPSPPTPPFSHAMELLGAGYCPTRRGWIFDQHGHVPLGL
jgi:hypothetical protein